MIVGLDIGGHHVAGALLNNDGGAIVGDSYRHRAIGRHAGKSELLDAWAGLINALASGAPEVEGIGIGEIGAFALLPGFNYAVTRFSGKTEILPSASLAG